jgi:hypothetical protein
MKLGKMQGRGYQSAGLLCLALVTLAAPLAAQEGHFSIGGKISGLNGTLVLQNNLADDFTTRAIGTFSFAFETRAACGTRYSVTIKTQPLNQVCTVSNGEGTVANATVTDVSLACRSLPAATLEADSGIRSAMLRWRSPASGTRFNVLISSQPGCDVRNLASCADRRIIQGATSPLTVPDLQNGRAWYFWIESELPDGERSYSDRAVARPNVMRPTVP